MNTKVDYCAPTFDVVRDLDSPRPYYWVKRPAAVAIVAVYKGRMALVEQRRPAVDRQLLELPAGMVDEDERPLDAANRELREEIGYRAQSIYQIGEFYMSPGYSDEVMHLFFATDLVEDPLSRDEGEADMAVLWATGAGVGTLISNGTIMDAKSLIGAVAFRDAKYLHEQQSLVI